MIGGTTPNNGMQPTPQSGAADAERYNSPPKNNAHRLPPVGVLI
jgi:hypothetical protein